MKTQTAEKKLVIGTAVYMLGNIGSKLLQVLILPLITSKLQTDLYGYYDLIVTTISLISPIITLQMIEGMFRYLFNADDEERKATLSTVTIFLIVSSAGFGFLFWGFDTLIKDTQYPILIYLNYISAILFNYSQKLARCQKQNVRFAIAGVINTAVMLLAEAITLLVFHLTVDGMLFSNVISYIVASAYLLFGLNIKKEISLNRFDRKLFKKLIVYSAPLIPNSLAWWMVASFDKYVITYALGPSSNGIYAIASKFPQLLTLATSVFQLAWQESAIMEEKSKKRDEFYTKTFNIYFKLLLSGFIIALPFIKISLKYLLDESYQSGYLYIPILLLGSVFAAFSQFFGSAYLVFKKTSGAFTTTIIAAIVNLIVGVGLIKYMGLFAPALGTMVAFGVQWLIRVFQLKDSFRIKFEVINTIALLGIAIVVSGIYYIENALVQFVCLVFALAVAILFNKEIITKLRGVIKRRIAK